MQPDVEVWTECRGCLKTD